MSEFEKCKTKAEAQTLLDGLCTEPRLEIADYKKAFNKRCKRIREDELYPFHLLAKQFQHGDKVYFGKADSAQWMDMVALKVTDNYSIKAGAWCYVWKYQPRAKILWLCHPGKKLAFVNIIDHAFSVAQIQRLEISRVEPEIRSSDISSPATRKRLDKLAKAADKFIADKS